MKIGIDQIAFYVPKYYVDLVDVAEKRGIDPNKFTIGIGQEKMAVPSLCEDIVSMGANAARKIVDQQAKAEIDMVIVGTESALDFSKASAVTIHRLLGIQPFARCIEIKEACYGATAALAMANHYIQANPDRKVLVIASDIARYGLATPGEPTQGAGAVAMLISQNPRILTFNQDHVFYTTDVMDFWRPNYSETAMVDGKLSNEAYIESFQTVLKEYQKRTNKTLANAEAICFHIPYTKMGKKALQTVLDTVDESTSNRLLDYYEESILYSKRIGNMYTGSLYLGLISLLENSQKLKAGQELWFYSYGSGAVCEMFSGTLVAGFEKQLLTKEHQEMLAKRTQLTVDQYETLFEQKMPTDTKWQAPVEDICDGYYVAEVDQHIRTYQFH